MLKVVNELFCSTMIPTMCWGRAGQVFDKVVPGTSKKMMALVSTTAVVQLLAYAHFKKKRMRDELHPLSLVICTTTIPIILLPLTLKMSRAWQSALPLYLSYEAIAIVNMGWVL